MSLRALSGRPKAGSYYKSGGNDVSLTKVYHKKNIFICTFILHSLYVLLTDWTMCNIMQRIYGTGIHRSCDHTQFDLYNLGFVIIEILSRKMGA